MRVSHYVLYYYLFLLLYKNKFMFVRKESVDIESNKLFLLSTWLHLILQ